MTLPLTFNLNSWHHTAWWRTLGPMRNPKATGNVMWSLRRFGKPKWRLTYDSRSRVHSQPL